MYRCTRSLSSRSGRGEAHVTGNRIANTTEPAINFRQIEGRAMVNQNVITTGSVVAKPARNQVIRVAGSGLYRIANNVIQCDWANPDAEGVGLFSNVAASPIEHAVVENNEITMATPPATAFTAFSAGIGVPAEQRVHRQSNRRFHAGGGGHLRRGARGRDAYRRGGDGAG